MNSENPESFEQHPNLLPQQSKNEPGLKYDYGKPTFEYLPDDALAEINKVLTFGARKYDARNWEKGMSWLRCWNAAFRHLWAWARGEKLDPETGLPHLAHAGCCVLFLISYELRSVGVDDRLPVLSSDQVSRTQEREDLLRGGSPGRE